MADYSQYTRKQLVETIFELETLNRHLLAERAQEDRLTFSWTGNLGHWYFNIKTGRVVFNPMKAEALRFAMEELPEKVHYTFFTDKVHPDDHEATMQAMKDHMTGKTDVYECEYRIQAKDGSWKWFQDRGRITKREADGTPVFAAGVVFDVTDKAKQVYIDALTGAWNRKAIMEELQRRMQQAQETLQPLSVAMLDIDHFKAVNDTRGHVFGDKVLAETARAIQDSIRGHDSLGRYGGEEFILILPDTTLERAGLVCDRIRENIAKLAFEDGFKATISCGAAVYESEDILALVDKADRKLYEAKASGRNRVVI